MNEISLNLQYITKRINVIWFIKSEKFETNLLFIQMF